MQFHELIDQRFQQKHLGFDFFSVYLFRRIFCRVFLVDRYLDSFDWMNIIFTAIQFSNDGDGHHFTFFFYKSINTRLDFTESKLNYSDSHLASCSLSLCFSFPVLRTRDFFITFLQLFDSRKNIISFRNIFEIGN